jgi:hypothetical protein
MTAFAHWLQMWDAPITLGALAACTVTCIGMGVHLWRHRHDGPWQSHDKHLDAPPRR